MAEGLDEILASRILPPAGVLGAGDEVGSGGSMSPRIEGWLEHGDDEVVRGIVKEGGVVEM